MKNTINRKNNYTNSDDAVFFEFLWACGKFALIMYVIYRITVILGITPEG